MHFSTLSLAASAVLFAATSTTSAAALPVSNEANSAVRVALVRSENGQLAQLKRTGGLNLERRAQTASLFNALGREYFIEVGIGTPAQIFNLTLDTGSAELWVPSTSCPSTTCPYQRFDSSKSSTYKGTNTAFKIQYGIGSAEGTYARETVMVGNAKVENQTIGLAKSTKDILGVVSSGEQANGIFGLGFPGLNAARGASNVTPFAFNLMPKLENPIFSVFLNKHFSFGYSGEVMFGGTDSSKYTANIEYVPVASYDLTGYNVSPLLGSKASQKGTYLYWTVPGQGIAAGSYSENFSDLQGLILDTGTTLTMIPQKYVEGILNAIAPGKYVYSAVNGVYSVDCGLASSSETVKIHLSTSNSAASSTPVTITTPVSELVIPLDTDYLETATTCVFGITSSGTTEASSGQTWIIGEATLRAVYTVHDMKNNRVGLAPANFNGKVAMSSSPHNATAASTTKGNTSSSAATNAANSTTTTTSSSPSSANNGNDSAAEGSGASKNNMNSSDEVSSAASATITLARVTFAVSLAVSASLLL